jgi:hypothetical protein
MKIIVFGANSPTAQFMIQQLASTKSVEIYGLIRSNPEELFQNASVSYLTYAISQLEKIRGKIEAADVWISFIGASGLFKARKITTLYSDSATFMLREAEYSKPSRIMWISSGGIVDNPNDGFFFKRILKPFFLKNMYHDMRTMEQRILDSKVNYTIVRPPYLTSGKLPEKVRSTEYFFPDDKTLNRISLGHFLAEELINPKWEKKIVAVST